MEGGAGNAAYFLSRELAARGHRLHVITAVQPHAPPPVAGVQVTRIPVAGWEGGAFPLPALRSFASAAFRAAMEAEPPDVTLAFFGWPGGGVARRLRVARGIPYVVALRGSDVPGFRLPVWHPVSVLARPHFRAIWREAGAVVANSESLRALARRTWDGPVEVIPNGVDARTYAPGAPGVERPFTVLTVSQLVPRKRIDLLLEAWARFRRAMPGDARLRVIGRGREEAALRARASRLGIDETVEWRGAVDRGDMPAEYRAADVFVLLSRQEGMSNALLEAMASGLPCISTPVGDADAWFADGRCGVRVEPDADAVCAALQALATDAPRRGRLGDGARAFVTQHASWSSVAEAYESLLARVVQSAGGRQV